MTHLANTPGSFPPRRLSKSASRMGRRARQVVELMVFGAPDGSKGPMTRREVAAFLAIKEDTVYRYESSPQARAYFRELCRAQREAEVPRNTVALISIREDPAMRLTAAGQRARIESIRTMEDQSDIKPGGATPQGAVVVPGVVVTINLQPRDPDVIDDRVIEINPANPSALPSEPERP